LITPKRPDVQMAREKTEEEKQQDLELEKSLERRRYEEGENDDEDIATVTNC
jgi:hypothetical protein